MHFLKPRSFLAVILLLILSLVPSLAMAKHRVKHRMVHTTHVAPSSPTECMANAIYHEAGNESTAGMAAVGYVILNRTQAKAFPSSVCGVVYQASTNRKTHRRSCQFSWACKPLKRKVDPTQLAKAKQVARRVMARQAVNPIGASIYFHALREPSKPSRHARVVRRLGGHIFYADSRVYTGQPGHVTEPLAS